MKCLLPVLIGFGVATASIAEEPSISGTIIDAGTLRIQEKVEALFAAEEYKRAHFIYLHELAPIGDKYAQYMLGFIYEHGIGVETDLIEASAWYRIAAERGKAEFVEVRDSSLRYLSDEDREKADSRYLELRQRYSDLAVMLRQVREDYETLMAVRTGTRIPGGGRSLVMMNPDQQAGDADLLAAERRIARGLAFLSTQLAKPEYNVRYTDLDIDQLRRDVDALLARLD